MRREDAKQPFIHEAEPEHDEMRRLIAQLRRTSGADPRHDDLVMELMRDVIHHVADEETRLLPDAENILGKARLSERAKGRQAGQGTSGRLLGQQRGAGRRCGWRPDCRFRADAKDNFARQIGRRITRRPCSATALPSTVTGNGDGVFFAIYKSG
jgi:hypothetical protein